MKAIKVLFAVSVFFVSACTSTYQQRALTAPVTKLATGAPVLIATPANGAYGGREYYTSGASTASAVRVAFTRYSDAVTILSTCRDIACLRASDRDASYLVVPEILHWEDRNTEWSGKKDKIEIKIVIHDRKTGQVIASNIISGKSKWATFGGDHPQDLLSAPTNSYIESLY